ncbi:helix-turn-helix domain-containing protein, partial [Chromobacterium fluminis]|uniref:helix-turn-helix domain-containing protein n=1 Tax=Chromobacterium fluminis TaxID=3044269 RepID=UPI001F0EDCCC
MTSLNQNIIKHKIGLLNLAAELGNVSKACKVMGLSRDTFYRYQNAVADGGVEALFDANRRKPNPKNRVDDAIEATVVAYATEQPAHGQVRVSNELRQRGVFVSPSGVRSVWLRHDLASFKQRLRALEHLVAEQAIVLTDAQIAALERKQEDDVAHGEIETAHPGYLGSQDTFARGGVRNSVCGGRLNKSQPRASVKRSPNRIANWLAACFQVIGGI